MTSLSTTGSTKIPPHIRAEYPYLVCSKCFTAETSSDRNLFVQQSHRFAQEHSHEILKRPESPRPVKPNPF